jgi:hypothetical protein
MNNSDQERRDRESREYFSMSASEYEARGMPTSFKKAGYALPRANLMLVRQHLQDALQAGASGDVLRAIVLAIREVER